MDVIISVLSTINIIHYEVKFTTWNVYQKDKIQRSYINNEEIDVAKNAENL